MATGAQVFDALMAGSANNRARREQDYTEQRRAVVDPYTDAELARTETARNAIVEQYGVQAGDPAAQSTAQATSAAIERQPEALRSTKLNNDVVENSLQNTIDDRFIGAARNVLTSIKKTNPDDPAAGLANISPAIKLKLGITPEEEAEMSAALQANPGALDMMIEAFSNPEAIRQVLTRDADGKPMYTAVGERGTVTDLDISPYANPLDEQEQRARIAAVNRSNQPKPGKAEEGATAADQMNVAEGIRDMKQLIVEGANTGAFVVTGGDTMQNIGAALANNPFGQQVQRAIGAPEQRIRDGVRSITPALANGLRLAGEMGVRMLDTEKEYERFIAQINDPQASAQAMLETLDRLERNWLREAPPEIRNMARLDGGAEAATPGVGGDVIVSFEDFMAEGQ